MLVWSRRVLVLGVLGVGGYFGYGMLREAGFRFRWEDSAVREVLPDASSGRPMRRVATSDGSVASNPTGAPGSEPTAGESSRAPEQTPSDDPITSTALEAPPGVAEVAPGSGPAARIDFETSATGGPPCSPCAVSDEWAASGMIVSFRSWTADSTTPYVLDGTDYLPGGSSAHALGPALRGEAGLEVGVMRLDFPGRPRSVSFSVFGADIVRRFDITAWSGDRILRSAVGRAAGRTYDPAGRGLFREEIITVSAETGIDRISLDGWGPPGHLLFVDDVVITP